MTVNVKYAGKENCDSIEMIMEMIKDNYIQFSNRVHAKKNTGMRQIVLGNVLKTGFLNLV